MIGKKIPINNLQENCSSAQTHVVIADSFKHTIMSSRQEIGTDVLDILIQREDKEKLYDGKR